MKLYRIDAPRRNAGLEIKKEKFHIYTVCFTTYKVIKAPPILKYMIGWSLEKVENYCKKKGWKLDEIPEEIVAVV